MKRLLIFVCLGPPLGMATLLFVMLPLLNGASTEGLSFDWHQIVLLPVAYFLGILPAAIAAAADHALETRQVRLRILWTSAFAFVASFIPLLPSILFGFIQTPWILPFGIIGALPAAICAWLSGNAQRAPSARRARAVRLPHQQPPLHHRDQHIDGDHED